MAVVEVVHSSSKREFTFPVSGAGSNIPLGTLMIPGASGGTNFSIAIPVAANSGSLYIGLLNELHNFSASGDATTATLVDWFNQSAGAQLASGKTAFPSHPIELLDNATIVRMDYALSTATQVSVASSTSTVITITSTEANLDGGYAYIVAGTGIGNLHFIKSSTTGAWTVTSAMTTTPDATSKLIKVLPIFYSVPVFLVNTTTVPALLDSTAAAGSGAAVCLRSCIQKNGLEIILNPKSFHNTGGYNSLAQFAIYSLMNFQLTSFHP